MKNKYFFNAAVSATVSPLVRPLRAALGGVALIVALLGGLLFVPVDETQADDPNEGHVVVVFPNGKGIVRDITFSGEISRTAALQLTELDVVVNGGTVCAIEGVGCPATNCFCPDNWWSQSNWITSTKTWSGTFPSPTNLGDGTIVGYRWSNTAFGPPRYPGSAYRAAFKALDWLRTQQQFDGSYIAGFGSPAGPTLDTMLSMGANGIDGDLWRRNDSAASVLDYLKADGDTEDAFPNNAAAFADSNPSSAGKLVLGLAAVGQDPTNFDGLNAVNIVTGAYSPTAGVYIGNKGSQSNWDQAFSLLALSVVSETIPLTAVQSLKDRVNPDGGWGFSPSFTTTTADSTGLVLQALAASGVMTSDGVITQALAYLETAQGDNGGFPKDSEANSTALVLQGLLAVGEDPTGARWTKNGNTPFDFLLSLQQADGSIYYQPGQPGFSLNLATNQPIPPLLGQPFPIATTTYTIKLDQLFEMVYLPAVLKSN